MENGATLVVNPAIKVTVNAEKTGLVIEIPFESSPRPSRQGKTFVVASTHGLLKTGVKFKREAEILLQVNALIDFNL